MKGLTYVLGTGAIAICSAAITKMIVRDRHTSASIEKPPVDLIAYRATKEMVDNLLAGDAEKPLGLVVIGTFYAVCCEGVADTYETADRFNSFSKEEKALLWDLAVHESQVFSEIRAIHNAGNDPTDEDLLQQWFST